MINSEQRRKIFSEYTRRILAGDTLDVDACRELINTPEREALLLCQGADLLRESRFGRTVHLCVIRNAKSGRCSEDCSFCSQSIHADTGIEEYPLMSRADLIEVGRRLEDSPVNRYSIVTSGKRLSPRETGQVAEALSSLDQSRIKTCASLGILEPDQLRLLKEAGVSRYHHNLETAASLFDRVCTTHTYQDRVNTVKSARAAGLSVCCGGIFGLGESNDQIMELALALRDLRVDAVPVNFLVPIKGTPAADRAFLNPMKCLKIVAFLRYALPDKEIIICGGREDNLQDLHPLIFYAGASGIMTGDYLTTRGRSLDQDLALLKMLQMEPRP